MPSSRRTPPTSRPPLSKRAPRLARLKGRFPFKKHSPLRALVVARAGGRTSGGALPGGRLTRPLGAIVTLLLLGISVRTLLNQRLPLAAQIERAARLQYIPQLEKKLGQKIEVGRFSTDWLGRVHVESIVVGRNPRLPTGALIQAKSVTLSLDVIGLALGRSKFPDAVTGVDIDAPQLFLKRDAKGKINLASLLSSSGAGTGNRWSGHLGLHDGRVFYVDEGVRSRSNELLRLDTRGVNAEVEILAPRNDTSAAEFNGHIGQTLLVGANAQNDLGAFPLRGRVVSQSQKPARGWIETQTPVLSASLLAPWVRSSPVDVRSGTLGGKIQVAFVGGELAPRGELTLNQVSLLVPRPKAAPIEVRELSGPLGFAGTAFQTAGLRAQVAGAHWNAKGRAALGEKGEQPLFDGDVSTRDFSLANARPLLPPNTLPPQLSAGLIGLDAHLSGTPTNLRANGEVNARNASWNDAQDRRAAFPSVRATGVLALNGKLVQLATRFETSGGEAGARLPQVEQVRLNAKRWSGTIRGGGKTWDVNALAEGWTARAARGGGSSGQSAHLVASSDATGKLRGALEIGRATTSGLRLAALFPSASAIASSGELNARARFESNGTDWKRARLAGTVSLSRLALAESAIPASNRVQIARALGNSNVLAPYLQARDVEADLSLDNGMLRVSRAQAQTLAGPIRGALQTPLARLAPQFWVSAPQLRLPPETLARLAAARGVRLLGSWNGNGALRASSANGRIALDAVLRLSAPTFEARDARGGARINGTNAQLNLSAGLNAARPRFTAQLSCDALSATSGALGSTGVVVPPTLSGARAAGVQLVATSVAGNPLPSATTRSATAQTAPLRVAELSPTEVAFSRSDLQSAIEPQQLADASDIFNSLEGREVFGSSVCAPRRVVALPARSTRDANPWTMSVSARRVAVAVAALKGRIVTLRDVSALGNSIAGGVALPRVAFSWGASGRVDGSLRLGKSGLSGLVLARSIEAATLQNLLGRADAKTPQLRGLLNARATLLPNAPTRVEAQMATGSVVLPFGTSRRALRVRALSFAAQANRKEVRLTSASGFLGEARVGGEAVAQLASGQIGARLRVAGLSLAPYAAMLGAPPVAGLVRADVRVRFNSRTSQLELAGQTHLDGGAFRGASLELSDAQIGATWNTRSRNATLRLANWRGRLEGAPFSGSLSLDTARNAWSTDLAATGVSLLRLARLNARLKDASATTDELSRLTPPVEGVAGGQLGVRGTLFAANGRTFSPRPQSGFARLSVPRLGWQAKTIGALDGTFNLAKGRIEFAPLLLHPVEGEAASNTLSLSPSLSLVGSVPIARGGGPLDARLSVGEAPLEFFASSLLQGRDALATAGFDSPFLDSSATYVSNLPRGLQGRVALEAAFGGTWSAPVLHVSRLTLRNGRTPLPTGGLSLPATLDAAFTLQKGELFFERGQFRLAKAEVNPSKTPLAGAAPPDEASDGDEDDDTLVQVQSGARLSLTGQSDLVADVLNANLSQLAPWVPALRGANGEALLKGQLEGFSVRIQGPATDPIVTGSVEAQNIAFRGRSIERLRVARFDIGGGLAKIEPGNFTVKEGRFESSAASGSVAWDWKRFGPVPNGELKLQFPLATRDFGALAALFVPQFEGARADEFSGMVEVGGTVNAPQFRGNIALKNAGFRLASSPNTPVALGVGKLSGALRFQDGNRLVIDADNPLRGELVSAEPTPAPATKGKAPAKNSKTKTAASPASPFRARGAFGMRGAVTLAGADLTQALSDLPSALAENVYDLRFDLTKGALEAPPTSGVRDVVLTANLRTENPNDASHSQTVRWMAAARGQSLGRKIGAGELLSRGAMRLRSDFASGFSSLSRSTPLAWTAPTSSTSIGDLSDSDAAKRLKDSDFVSTRPQLVLRAFAAKATGYGSAVVDGRLFLDKGASRSPRIEPNGPRIQTASTQSKGERLFGSWREGDVAPIRPLDSARRESEPLFVADENQSDLPLRLAGDLTVSNAQIVGGGSGGDGQVTRLSLLPDAPRLDLRVSLGKSVQLVNSTLRARLVGDVSVSGTPSDPLLLGTVSLLDGQVRFPNARARVEEGTVNINVARDPESDLPRIRLDVDALARGQSGRYTVTLKLHGPLQFDSRNSQNKSNLQIDVSSNPPLSQDEAFAQLLGIAPRDFQRPGGGTNVGAANQAYAQAVLQLVSAPFFSGVERSVAQALGLSSVSFEYRFNEPLAFELSKALNDRVVVSYRRTFGATQQSAGVNPFELRIDYRVRGDYFLGLKTDERNVRTLTLQKSFRF